MARPHVRTYRGRWSFEVPELFLFVFLCLGSAVAKLTQWYGASWERHMAVASPSLIVCSLHFWCAFPVTEAYDGVKHY